LLVAGWTVGALLGCARIPERIPNADVVVICVVAICRIKPGAHEPQGIEEP